MKELLLVIMSVLFISACSSTGDRRAENTPEYPEFPIEEDKGYKLVDDQIYHNGELLGTIESGHEGDDHKYVTTPDGELIAIVIRGENNMWSVSIIDPGSNSFGGGDLYSIDTSHGEIKVDWASSIIDGRYGNDAPNSEPVTTSAKMNKFKRFTAGNFKTTIKTKR